MKKFFKIYVFCFFILSGLNSTFCQSTNPEDIYWDGKFGNPTRGGYGVTIDYAYIYAICKGDDGIYFGGSFLNIGSIVADGIAKWDGKKWTAIGDRFTVRFGDPPSLSSILSVGKNLYFGGTFDTIGSVASKGIAMYDGSKFIQLSGGVNGIVKAIEVYKNEIIVAGTFNSAGGVLVNNIAKWNGSSWSSLGEGLNSAVITLKSDGENLYVGGSFTKSGNMPVNNIAKWDGSTWSSVGEGFNGGVYSLIYKDSVIYAGGDFKKSGNKNIRNIARWNGKEWSSLDSGLFTSVQKMEIYKNEIYVKNNCEYPNSYLSNLIKWDGDKWSIIDPQNRTYARILCLSAIDSFLYVGGNFPYINGIAASNIAKWDGKKWYPVSEDRFTYQGSVRALVSDRDNLYVGGTFDFAGNITSAGIAKWDGNRWYPMGNEFINGSVTSITLDGKNVIAGGYSDSMSTGKMIKVSIWNGIKWTNIGREFDGDIKTIAVKGDTIYVGGEFKKIGNDSIRFIARWDGNKWSNVGQGLNMYVYTIIAKNNDLYVGGLFKNSGTKTLNYIAKWDGNSWSSVGGGVSNAVRSILFDGSDIIAAGYFKLLIADKYYSMAKWDSVKWTAPWNWNGFSLPAIYAVKRRNDDLYIGGETFYYNQFLYNDISIEEKEYKNTINFGWGDGLFVFENGICRRMGSPIFAPVYSIAILGKDVYIGGMFSKAGDKESFGIARWSKPTNKVIEEKPPLKNIFSLNQNYPNPFNPSTVINYTVGANNHLPVQLRVYDILGREVACLVNEKKQPGTYQVNFNGNKLTSGIYFYRLVVSGSNPLQTEKFTEIKKMIYLK